MKGSLKIKLMKACAQPSHTRADQNRCQIEPTNPHAKPKGYWLPFITPPYKIIPFDLGTAAILVTVVFVIRAILGFMAVIVWNTVRQQ